MPAPAQKVTIAKSAGGVLPISAVTSQQGSGADNTKAQIRGPSQKLKVVVRRLPPGLTQAEFEDILGEEWRVGQGKIAWALYRPGKVSKDLSKPSRPARAYFQVTQQSHIETLADKVRHATFLDARNTANDGSLLGPPILEFAPYGRVPSGKRRNDARQGLIDQDPEFMAFLESLTTPIPKTHTVDGLEAAIQQKEDPLKVTPLIQHLRDKKAAKEAAKEAAKDKEKAAAKAPKHTRQSSKTESTSTSGSSKATKVSAEAGEKKATRAAKPEKITKQTTKQTKKEQQTVEPKPQTATRSTAAEATKPGDASVKRPEKSSQASAAARMIQRDLGLRGGRGGSRSRGGRQTSDTNPSASPPSGDGQTAQLTNGKTTSTTSTTQSDPANADTIPPKPAILKREPGDKPISTELAPRTQPKNTPNQPPALSSTENPPSSSAPAPKAKAKPAVKPPPSISPNATAAFLKHANPSQGITEPLISSALSAFGEVTHVEIDKRKGFAYVDFAEPEGLKKAILASPVKVAQGSVQVLERKERAPAVARGGGAAGAQGRGGSAAAPPRNAAAGGSATAATATTRGGKGRGRGGPARGGASVAADAATVASSLKTPSAVDADPVQAVQTENTMPSEAAAIAEAAAPESVPTIALPPVSADSTLASDPVDAPAADSTEAA